MFKIESRHLLNSSVQNALDCISEKFSLKNFPGGACALNSLEKGAVRSPYGCYPSFSPSSLSPTLPPPPPLPLLPPVTQARRYRSHITTVYYISRPPCITNFSRSAPAAYLVTIVFCLTSIQFKQTLTLVKNNWRFIEGCLYTINDTMDARGVH